MSLLFKGGSQSSSSRDIAPRNGKSGSILPKNVGMKKTFQASLHPKITLLSSCVYIHSACSHGGVEENTLSPQTVQTEKRGCKQLTGLFLAEAETSNAPLWEKIFKTKWLPA